jgi:hypothetical protein
MAPPTLGPMILVIVPARFSRTIKIATGPWDSRRVTLRAYPSVWSGASEWDLVADIIVGEAIPRLRGFAT